jgi:hypothetical protein
MVQKNPAEPPNNKEQDGEGLGFTCQEKREELTMVRLQEPSQQFSCSFVCLTKDGKKQPKMVTSRSFVG